MSDVCDSGHCEHDAAITSTPTGYGWLISEQGTFAYQMAGGRALTVAHRHLGLVEPVGKRFKAKLNGLLVRSDAGPMGLYPTLEAAIAALRERSE